MSLSHVLNIEEVGFSDTMWQ